MKEKKIQANKKDLLTPTENKNKLRLSYYDYYFLIINLSLKGYQKNCLI